MDQHVIDLLRSEISARFRQFESTAGDWLRRADRLIAANASGRLVATAL